MQPCKMLSRHATDLRWRSRCGWDSCILCASTRSRCASLSAAPTRLRHAPGGELKVRVPKRLRRAAADGRQGRARPARQAPRRVQGGSDRRRRLRTRVEPCWGRTASVHLPRAHEPDVLRVDELRDAAQGLVCGPGPHHCHLLGSQVPGGSVPHVLRPDDGVAVPSERVQAAPGVLAHRPPHAHQRLVLRQQSVQVQIGGWARVRVQVTVMRGRSQKGGAPETWWCGRRRWNRGLCLLKSAEPT
mmetsp:Transcript_19148/g.36932  ORF Transcript_19148/g.36932 Transcript_19148/m.36932 type:complete len:244 (-) Transcript_19148:323-1054(-)